MRPASSRGASGGPTSRLPSREDAARDLGAATIRLDTRLDPGARALYRRHGYVKVPAFDASDYAEVWYAKNLAVPRADGSRTTSC